MNVKKLIKKFEERKTIIGNFQGYAVWWEDVKEIFEQLDEPGTGHADEAPRYVKNILARLRELPVHDREVWLKAIMGEFEQDFSHAKWREGYEQGKLEGAWVGNQLKDADKIRSELNKVQVPQFVADWYEENKDDFETSLFQCIYELFKKRNDSELSEFENWVIDENTKPFQTFVNMHQFGYEVEKEKRYLVKVKGVVRAYLNYDNINELWNFNRKQDGLAVHSYHTRKELEEANFGWVFDCEGIEVEEVE